MFRDQEAKSPESELRSRIINTGSLKSESLSTYTNSVASYVSQLSGCIFCMGLLAVNPLTCIEMSQTLFLLRYTLFHLVVEIHLFRYHMSFPFRMRKARVNLWQGLSVVACLTKFFQALLITESLKAFSFVVLFSAQNGDVRERYHHYSFSGIEKKNKVPGYSLTFLKATQLVNVKTKIQLYQVQRRNLSSNLRSNRSCHAILMLLLGEQAITSSEKSHYLFLKAVFACSIDSKISHKGINSGRFSNRKCGTEEGAASSLPDPDEVNLTNGGLLLVLKASKLYFRSVVSKYQKSSVV